MAGLKPCGTSAAYRKHLRNGETPCDECRSAVRSQVAGSRAEGRRVEAEARLSAVPDAKVEDPEPLEIARENYAIVTATLYGNDVSSSAIARLTERREQLADRIRKLNGSDKAEVSVLDQLAQRRKDRVANS